MSPSIFVQIPSYRDPETLNTLQDAVVKACHPEKLYFGVCWQYKPGCDEKLLPRKSLPRNTRILSVSSAHSGGACWARHKVQSLYQGEDYTLSIDSHTRFTEGWDRELLEEFKCCDNPRAVLSNYPAAYTSENGFQTDRAPSVLGVGYIDNRMPRFCSLPAPQPVIRPVRGLFVAAGFHFAKGSVIKDVPADPYLYFNQEEILLATRLWCHGYDIYSPTRDLLFHLYRDLSSNTGKHSRVLHLEEHADWVQLNLLANQRALHLLCVEQRHQSDALREIERYGLAKHRLLEDFISLAGLDFTSDSVCQRANNADYIYDLNPWLTHPGS